MHCENYIQINLHALLDNWHCCIVEYITVDISLFYGFIVLLLEVSILHEHAEFLWLWQTGFNTSPFSDVVVRIAYSFILNQPPPNKNIMKYSIVYKQKICWI